jgi:hypothetical protein
LSLARAQHRRPASALHDLSRVRPPDLAGISHEKSRVLDTINPLISCFSREIQGAVRHQHLWSCRDVWVASAIGDAWEEDASEGGGLGSRLWRGVMLCLPALLVAFLKLAVSLRFCRSSSVEHAIFSCIPTCLASWILRVICFHSFG